MTEEYKFACDKCQFFTNYKSKWDKHERTTLHQTGKKKVRSDKKRIDKCTKCDYTSSEITNMTQHILNEHGSLEEKKEGFTYYCEYCDYGTFAKTLEDKHKQTKKHLHIVAIVNAILK